MPEVEMYHGPFDPDDLVRWAEMYGDPEEWAKRAQDAVAKQERAERERDYALRDAELARGRADRYREALRDVVVHRHDVPGQGALADIAQRALDA